MELFKYDKKGKVYWGWKGYIGIDPMTNKERNSSKRGFKTKKEAKEDFLKRQHELLNNKIVDEHCTLEKLIESFFEYKKDKIKQSTLNHYKYDLRGFYDKGIIDVNKKINKFTVVYCQSIYNKIKANYKSPKTKLMLLKTIFNYAVKMELLESNPFTKVDTTERQTNEVKQVNHYEVDELREFISATKKLNNPMYHYLFLLLVKTGMRNGEARALNWSDVNFKDKTITINKTVTKDFNNKWIIGDTPKTKSSNRVIAIDDSLVKSLKEWKAIQAQFRSMKGLGFNNKLVFHRDDYNLLTEMNVIYNMKKACELANVPYIKPHGLRHTFIALAIESGLQPIDIAHTVGHNNIDMIMEVYDSMTKKRNENVATVYANYVCI